MIENPLELADGFGGLTGGEVGQSANVDGVQTAEASDVTDAAQGEVVARGGLQRLNRRCRIVRVQRRQGPKRRQIHGLNKRAFRELAREILGEASRLRQVTGEGQRERRGIVHVAAPAKRERLAGALPGGGRIPVERFPHRSARFEQAGPFALTRSLRDLDGDRGRPSRVA